MTSPAALSRRPRHRLTPPARLVVAAAVAVVALLAGCSTHSLLNDLTGDLRRADLRDPVVTFEPGATGTLIVIAKAPTDSTTAEGQDLATEVVWEQFPRQFDHLQLTIDGERTVSSYADLEEALGARSPDLDRTDLRDEVNRTALSLLVAILIAGLLFVALTTVVALLVVRKRRRRPAAAHTVMYPSSADQARVAPTGHGPGAAGPEAPEGGWVRAEDAMTQTPSPIGPATWPGAATPRPAPGFSDKPRPTLTKQERRLHGRLPPGRVPDEAHTPPGWEWD